MAWLFLLHFLARWINNNNTEILRLHDRSNHHPSTVRPSDRMGWCACVCKSLKLLRDDGAAADDDDRCWRGFMAGWGREKGTVSKRAIRTATEQRRRRSRRKKQRIAGGGGEYRKEGKVKKLRVSFPTAGWVDDDGTDDDARWWL